jgi:isoleucyl-tRNA synthetase
VAINQHAPYKQVLTHGFVVDQDGKKMSKSLGNVISPKDVVNTLGADILRLWVASADYRGEMTISQEILNRAADGYRRIRNTARFMLGNLNEFSAEDVLPLDHCAEIDRWAVAKAEQLQREVLAHYDDYQLHLVFQKIHHFCSQDMGAFYLDVIKDRLYTCKDQGEARRSAQTAMHHILNALVRLIAPVLTFTADEIRLSLGHERHILFEQWYEFPEFTAVNERRWAMIGEIRQLVSRQLETLRVEGVIGSSLDASVQIHLAQANLDLLDDMADELRFVLITSDASLALWDDAAVDQGHELSDGSQVGVTVNKANGEKCIRCWHIRTDVGVNLEHPEICGRCVENVEGGGEQRRFA